jgi:uncharacterized protein
MTEGPRVFARQHHPSKSLRTLSSSVRIALLPTYPTMILQNLRSTIALLGFITLAVPLTAQQPAEPPSIEVTGSATTSTNPDFVQIDISVQTRDTSAQRASSENARIVANVLTALRGQLGVGALVSTVNYSLNPVYRHDEKRPGTTEFEATNTLRVETADLNKVGAIIDAATASGANNVNGILYTLRDQTKLRADALADAARQARSKAETLAAAMGLRLGGVQRIREGVQFAPGPVMERMRLGDGQGAPTQIIAGPVQMHADVTITFTIAR